MIKYSVVIPTCNRAGLLKNCLEALAKQTISKDTYEIIVVNDGSRDHTDAAVKEFSSSHPDLNFAYIAQKNTGVSAARNRGIREASGEIIFFTDDDCVVPAHWIETLSDGYRRHPDAAGVGGWYRYSEEVYRKSVYASYLWEMFSRRYPLHIEMKSNVFFKNPAGSTSNMSYRKSVLEEIGGFDEEMRIPGFDDWELKKRVFNLGQPLLYLPLFVLHEHPISAKEIAVRIFNFGRGRYLFIQKHPDLMRRYYPSFGWAFDAVSKRSFWRRADFQIAAMADFFLTRAGWEYQKLRQRFQ